MPKFEVFTRRATPVSLEPMMTIQRRGSLSLNRAAVEALGEPEAVELLYDRKERVMGIRPVDPKAQHAYKIRKQPSSVSFLIAGQAFTQYYGIPTDKPIRYRAKMADGVLTVDLKQEGIDATSTRERSRNPERSG